MRETWELPGSTMKDRIRVWGTRLAVLWAFIAVFLVVFLIIRMPDDQPPQPLRPLSVVEQAALSSAYGSLNSGTVEVRSDVPDSLVKLHVEQSVSVDRKASIGTVTSGAESAAILVNSGRVYLRATPGFWSIVGVPTSIDTWVEVDDKLGALPFPLASVTKDLVPNPTARIDNTSSSASQTIHIGDVTAEFTPTGIEAVTTGTGRRATVTPFAPPADDRINAALAAISGSPARLQGASGSLSVIPAPKPASSDTAESSSGR